MREREREKRERERERKECGKRLFDALPPTPHPSKQEQASLIFQ